MNTYGWYVKICKWARKSKKHPPFDLTMWILIAGWCGSILISYYFRSKDVSEEIRNKLMPHCFYYIGIVFLIGGTLFRDLSVWTLKRAFTLNVQTDKEQQLIQIGPYRIIRNPAYTGSIISLLGISFCLRSVYSPLIVLALCLLCYGIRIRKEETELANHFGKEFQEYAERTWRLFPLIY